MLIVVAIFLTMLNEFWVGRRSDISDLVNEVKKDMQNVRTEYFSSTRMSDSDDLSFLMQLGLYT
jgi:hypothetical protein